MQALFSVCTSAGSPACAGACRSACPLKDDDDDDDDDGDDRPTCSWARKASGTHALIT